MSHQSVTVENSSLIMSFMPISRPKICLFLFGLKIITQLLTTILSEVRLLHFNKSHSFWEDLLSKTEFINLLT